MHDDFTTLGDILDGPRHNASKPHLIHHWDLQQGSDEWLQTRCGLLTASEMSKIITPTLKTANNGETRSHLYDLAAQRITGYPGDNFQSYAMQRGSLDEILAAQLYDQKHNHLRRCGFITNNKWGFTLGYSPDGLLADYDGTIEIKSRDPKYQIETILKDETPNEYMIQIQTGLLISERAFCDFISYSGGLPMFVKRVYADDGMQAAILDAAHAAEAKIDGMVEDYNARVANDKTLIPTERRKEEIE